MPTVVLFDIDGTLVDSNDAHARAWELAFAEHERKIEFDAIRRAIGMGGDKLLPEVASIDAESTLGRKISDARARIFKQKFLPTLKPLPGARDTLLRVANAGMKVGIATSAKKEELKALLEIAGVVDLVDGASSSADAKNSKPDPDIVQAALAKNDAKPEDALFVGDTPYDVSAGRRAGVRVIGVRTGGWDTKALEGAVAVYTDLPELLARWDESPLGSSSVTILQH